MNILGVIEELETKTKANSRINENDFIGEDGLYYCGNCKSAKQVRVNFLGIEKTPFCMCKCEKEKYRAEEERKKQEEYKKEIAVKRNIAFPDCNDKTLPENDMRNWTFATDNFKRPELTNAAKRYVENFETFKMQGKGLLLYGTVGTGKSYMSACIANALIDRGYDVLVTTFNRIERTAFSMSDKQVYYDRLNSNDLLVIDDLGTERDSAYMQEIVFNVIDTRSRANLPLIVTSNLTNEEFKNPTGINNQRIYSRILEMCHPIKVIGEDQRKNKAVQNFGEMKSILGI